MSESKEAHRIRMRLKRSHPDWTNDRIRKEIKSELAGSQSSRSRFTGSQQLGKEGSRIGSQSSRREPSSRKRLKISFAYSLGIIRIYELRPDGSWRWIRDLRKGEEFQGIIYSWHNGRVPEDEL